MAFSVLMPNNSMNFSENHQGSLILDKLRIQRENGRFCDVTFHVKGKEFKAHRNVLAACSPYFDSVLKMHKIVKEQLTVSCRSHEAFQLLLNYMYTGTVMIDRSNVEELLRLANHFLILKLKNYCAEYLERYLDVTNCLSVKEMAEKYNMVSLVDNVTIFIQRNINTVMEQEEMLEYPLFKVESFLSSKSWYVPQATLMRFITRWVSCDISRRESDMRTLLTFINWHSLDRSFIEEHFAVEPLYKENKHCLFFCLDGLKESGINLYAYQTIYNNLKSQFGSVEPLVDNDKFMNLAISAAIEELQQMPLPSNTDDDNCGLVSVRCSTEKKNIKQMKENLGNELLTNNVTKKTAVESETGSGVCSRVSLKQRGINPNVQKFRFGHARNLLSTSRIRKIRLRCHQQIKNTKLRHSETKYPNGDRNDGDSNDISFFVHATNDNLVKWNDGVKCPHCSYVARSTMRLEEHVSSAHAKDITYKCRLCDFTCKWNREYYQHMKTHFLGPPFRCDSCDYTCDRIQLLLSHRMRHTDERPFKCEDCDYSCRTKANLAAHARCHTGEKPYRCEHCGRCFAVKGTLDQHLATHSNDRPFLCDICGFSTKYQSHLVSHRRIHSGDVFHCQHPNCNYSTPKRSQLSSHMRTHTAVRSHICSTCGRGFIEKSHLVRHERIHLNEKPFKCEECDYSSTRRDKLKEHIRKHHGVNATARAPYKPRKPRRQNLISTCYPTNFPTDNSLYQSQHALNHCKQEMSRGDSCNIASSIYNFAHAAPHGRTDPTDHISSVLHQSNNTVDPHVLHPEQRLLHNSQMPVTSNLNAGNIMDIGSGLHQPTQFGGLGSFMSMF